jgi:putative restriction endonuclease
VFALCVLNNWGSRCVFCGFSPPHDVAFDTGLQTVNGRLRIHVARSLADAVRTDHMARQYYGQPPLRESLFLPAGTLAPAPKYLDWHRQKIFQT